jgi:ABC-2 type transport system ATP-binding protein
MVDKGMGLNSLFELLSERGIKISSMRNRSNRLEELFIRLVTENGASSAD